MYVLNVYVYLIRQSSGRGRSFHQQQTDSLHVSSLDGKEQHRHRHQAGIGVSSTP